MLTQDHCKFFRTFAHTDGEIKKQQASKGKQNINVKPYQKVSNNRFQIFPSFAYMWVQHSVSFTTKGAITYLLKISQETPI